LLHLVDEVLRIIDNSEIEGVVNTEVDIELSICPSLSQDDSSPDMIYINYQIFDLLDSLDSGGKPLIRIINGD